MCMLIVNTHRESRCSFFVFLALAFLLGLRLAQSNFRNLLSMGNFKMNKLLVCLEQGGRSKEHVTFKKRAGWVKATVLAALT